MQKWTRNLKNLLNLFLETNCALCQRPTSQEVCLDCARQLQRCQLPDPTFMWQRQIPVFAWGTYGGTLKRAISALKYDNQPQLARPLGHWLGEAWLKSKFASKLSVVPIPLHADKLHQRGYNQAALLAESFCEITNLNLQQLGLERVRATEAQFGLSVLDREKNLAMAFKLGSGFRRDHPTKPILLLDDIYTTGATARSAVQTLQKSGIQVYGLVALAQAKA